MFLILRDWMQLFDAALACALIRVAVAMCCKCVDSKNCDQ